MISQLCGKVNSGPVCVLPFLAIKFLFSEFKPNKDEEKREIYLRLET